MRLIFMGTGEIAIPSLHWLIRSQTRLGFGLVAVYTQPDKPVGRKQVLTPPPVKTIAEEAGIPVFQPVCLRKDTGALETFASLDTDLAVVMAYGQILPTPVIDGPNIACVNLHASLLPRHRGASPVQAAIREGDAESGITLMHIAEKLDAGDTILKESIPLTPEDTGGILHDRLAELGPIVLEKGLPQLLSRQASREPQTESLVTYAGKLERNDGRIDWSLPAQQIERLIRAYDPWPGTYTLLPTGDTDKKLKIFPHTVVCDLPENAPTGMPPGSVLCSQQGLVIQCGEGALRLAGDIQLEGRKRLCVIEWLRGTSVPVGTILH